MRLFLAFLFSVLTLLPILTFADGDFRGRLAPVKFDDCVSHTLLVELNVQGLTPKSDLVEALKLFSEYPALAFTPADADRVTIAYSVSTRDACANGACALDAGFDELQVRLVRFHGVRITCAPGEASQSEQRPGQNAPKRDGGVTGGN